MGTEKADGFIDRIDGFFCQGGYGKVSLGLEVVFDHVDNEQGGGFGAWFLGLLSLLSLLGSLGLLGIVGFVGFSRFR